MGGIMRGTIKMEQLKKEYEKSSDKIQFLTELIQEVNNWDGSLDDYCYYENDKENLQMIFQDNLDELARAITYGKYHYRDKYIKINADGNLFSYSGYERDAELLEDAKYILEVYAEYKKDRC